MNVNPFNSYFILDNDDLPIECDDKEVWFQWMKDNWDRISQIDAIEEICISTSFMGFDHEYNTYLWHTEIYNRVEDRIVDSNFYSSKVNAQRGHILAVNRVRDNFYFYLSPQKTQSQKIQRNFGNWVKYGF